MTKKYIVEGIGYNDGKPHVCSEWNDIDWARISLDEHCSLHPRIAHRLVEVVEYREATD